MRPASLLFNHKPEWAERLGELTDLPQKDQAEGIRFRCPGGNLANVSIRKGRVVGRQPRFRWPVVFDFPADFPERLERFKEASGLSWRSLARLLGVNPYRLREWRFKAVIPSSIHLFLLLTLSESMGLREGILMRPDRDAPAAWNESIG